MKSPVHLFGQWWLVKDSTRPSDYPPEARDELTRNRVDVADYRIENQRLRAFSERAPVDVDRLLRLRNAVATAIEEADASHEDTIFVVRLINLCGLSFGGNYGAAATEIRSLGDHA